MNVRRVGWIVGLAVVAGSVAGAGEVSTRLMPAPPFAAFPAAGVKTRTSTRLVKVSERRNRIIDEDAWFARHGLKQPELAVHPSQVHASGPLPEGVETTFEGQGLLRAVEGPGSIQLLYGPDGAGSQYVVGWDKRNQAPVYQLDFRRYKNPPGIEDYQGMQQRVQWAVERNGVLYVSHFHHTYARSSGRRNAYITALDPKTGRMKWRSRALVCNSQNFLVLPTAIIAGYGFTDEPDFLYVLDRGTGAIAQTVPVKSGPEWLIQKGDRLQVRTYDRDYVFRIKA